MIELYKWIHILAFVLSIVFLILGIVLFFNLHICSVVKELIYSREQDDIKVLLKNSVLLNPQIQDDIPNIEGYNDLLASYFRILKAQEQQREEEEQRRLSLMRKKREQSEDNNLLTYNAFIYTPMKNNRQIENYNVIVKGTSVIVKYK